MDLVAGVATCALTFLLGVYWLTAMGLGLFAFLFVRFLGEVGQDLPIDTLLLMVASLQWILGPALCYAGFSNHYKYYMYVPEDFYMLLAVPGCLSLTVGVLLLQPRKHRHRRLVLLEHAGAIVRRFRVLPFYLVGVGLVCMIVRHRVPGSLGFVFYVLGNIFYIGILYGIQAFPRHRWHWLCGGMAFALLSSLQRAMFHDMLLWATLMGVYVAAQVRPSLKTKILAILGFVFVLFLVQSIKMQFREHVWYSGYSGSRLALAARLAEEQLAIESDDTVDSGLIDSMVIRINQGWIISRIMQMVPHYVPMAQGDTIREALFATLVPRFLYPDKPMAGGQVNFARFTGYELRGTSMGISLLGEGYANFGILGACIFLLLIGGLYSLAFRTAFWIGKKDPTLIMWLPLVFLHVVKAESELLVVLNYMVKAGVLVALFLFGSRILLGRRV